MDSGKEGSSRVVWIIGATGGIGSACAREFDSMGYRVAITGRNQGTLDQLLRDLSDRAIGVPCDITNEHSVAEAYHEIRSRLGRVEILVNAAGVFPGETFTETSIETFDATIETNVVGLFVPCQAVTPSMVEHKSGTIVNVLSIASEKAFLNGAAYVASKFAALGFTRSLREEVRKSGVKVIGILPGATNTPAWSEQMRADNRDRMMHAEDIAVVIRQAVEQPARMMTEEITIRPIGGDL